MSDTINIEDLNFNIDISKDGERFIRRFIKLAMKSEKRSEQMHKEKIKLLREIRDKL